MKKNIKIIVCCHKKDVMATEESYMPIHVGKAVSTQQIDIPGDDTGGGISEKNPYYCELTGMYWAWKNLKGVDIVGLCHYRRYFDFHGQANRHHEYDPVKTADFEKLDLSIPDKITDRLKDGTAVVANMRYYITDLFHDYCFCHISDDLKEASRVIRELTPEYYDSFNKVMWENNGMAHFNMFIMTWNDFDEYCSWLFKVLGELEKRISFENRDPWQRRVFGFLGERLLNVFLRYKRMRLIHRPVMLISDTVPRQNTLNLLQKRIRGYLACQISRRLDKNYDM